MTKKYSKTKQRINKCMKSKSKTLDLSECGLSDNAPELKLLEKCTHITELILSNNKLTKIPNLGNLVKLNILSLRNNQLQKIEGLETLQTLNFLDLSTNQLQKIEGLETLQTLQILDLSTNQLQKIEGLETLQTLKDLSLRNNQLQKIEGLETLQTLNFLDLSTNQLQKIEGLETLQTLNYLSLSNNQLKTVPDKFIKATNLSFKYIDKEITLEFEGLYLNGNPLESPPIEYLKQGKEVALEYLQNKEKEPLNECKVILVGKGKVGKTSLQKRLIKDSDFDTNEKETHGIRKVAWNDGVKSAKGGAIKVNFWDFGGQHIQQTLHQFFYSANTLYILVLDKRKDESPEDFLQIINASSINSPVIVVFNNKKDPKETNVFEYDLEPELSSTIRRKYPNIIKTIGVCAGQKKDLGMQKLREYLKEQIPTFEFTKKKHPKVFLKIKQQLTEQTSTNYIKYEDYQAICTNNKITEAQVQKGLAQMLNEVGAITFFNIEFLGTYYILNPDWLTTGAYEIILSKITEGKKGRIDYKDLTEIFEKEELTYQYNEQEIQFLLQLMERFSLCYKYEGKNEWLIPSVLKGEPKTDLVKYNNEAHTLYCLKYPESLPSSVIHRFVARNIENAYKEDYWENGIVVKHPNSETTIFVEADAKDKEIRLWIKGKEVRDSWQFFRKDFREFSKNFDCEETIKIENVIEGQILSEYINYEELLECQRAGEKEWFRPKLKKRINISDTLSQFENPNRKKTIKIFLASSSELEKERRAFEIFINRENKELNKKNIFLHLEIWEDFIDNVFIEGSQEQYNKAVRKSDIFVSLFFTKVGKYTEEEFDVAFKEYTENSKPIIYTYFKDAPITTKSITKEIYTLLDFKEKLKNLKHYVSDFKDDSDLHLQFTRQLKKLGLI